MTALSNSEVLAITADNDFVKVAYQATPKPRLTEISVTKVPYSINVAPAAANGFLLAATSEGKLLLMKSSTFEVIAEADLGGIASASPMVSGEHVFVEVANQEVKVFHLDNAFAQTASIDLHGSRLAGSPLALADGGFIAGRSDGLLFRLDANGAATEVTRQLGQALQYGPTRINEQVLVVGLDGSLYIIDPGLTE